MTRTKSSLLPALANPPAFPIVGAVEIATARGYLNASRAASTQKAYLADWHRFCLWCRKRDAIFLPAEPALVALYLSALYQSSLIGTYEAVSSTRTPWAPCESGGTSTGSSH